MSMERADITFLVNAAPVTVSVPPVKCASVIVTTPSCARPWYVREILVACFCSPSMRIVCRYCAADPA